MAWMPFFSRWRAQASWTAWSNSGAFVGAMRRRIGLINNLRLCLGRQGCRLGGFLGFCKAKT
jgi:hypothetical protein